MPSVFRNALSLVVGGLFFALVFPRASAQDHDYFVIGVHPNGVELVDGTTDQVVAHMQTRGRSPKELVPCPDGRHLFVTTDARQNIEVINLSSRKVEDVIHLAPAGVTLHIYGLAVSRDGNRLYAHVKRSKTLVDEFLPLPNEIWSVDVKSHETKQILEMPQGIVSLIVPKDPNRLFAWGRDIYIIDLTQGKIVDKIPLRTGLPPGRAELDTLPFFMQYEQSGILSMPYYANDPLSNKPVFGLANLEVDTGKFELMELGPPIPLYSSVISPDHKRAYLVMNQLVVVDLEQRKIVETRDTERTKYVANLTRDGKKLYLPSSGPFLDVYDTSTLQRIHRIELSGDASVSQLRALPRVSAP
jgi:DNA-binding beta-propeller fold protein YncE